MKIREVGAELFHADADRETNMTKLTVDFQNFGDAPKMPTRQKQLIFTRMQGKYDYTRAFCWTFVINCVTQGKYVKH
jgi:hypothetical protein